MKKQGAARVLRFAVTGALLGGGVGIGCAGKDRPNDDLHVNPGPDQPDGPVDAEPDAHVNTAEVEDPEPEPKPTSDVIVNTVKEPEVETNPGPQ